MRLTQENDKACLIDLSTVILLMADTSYVTIDMESILVYLHVVNTCQMTPTDQQQNINPLSQQTGEIFIFIWRLWSEALDKRFRLMTEHLLSRRTTQFVFLCRRFLSLWLLVEFVFL